MNNSKTQFWVIVGGLLIVAIIGLFILKSVNPGVSSALSTGAMNAEDYNPYLMYNGGYSSALPITTTGLGTFGSTKIGSSGSTMTLVKSGTCVLTSNATIIATSTGQGTCATTGSLAGDIVYLNLGTTTTAVTKQFHLLPNTVAGTDSTTVSIVNLTGASGVPAAIPTLGSTTQYQIFR